MMEYENQIYGSLCASAFIIILPLIVQLALPKFFPSGPAASHVYGKIFKIVCYQ
jgi:hypothetical protein